MPKPISIVDEIRAGYHRRDPIAHHLRRRLAKELFQRGETSLAFYKLVLIEAEHAHTRGEWSRGEALCRRAVAIAAQLDGDPLDAIGELGRMYRRRPTLVDSAAPSPHRARIIVQVDLVCTHMQLDLATLDYQPSAPQLAQVWLLVPADDVPLPMDDTLVLRVAPWIEAVFAEINRGHARDNDASFISARPYHARQLAPDQLACGQLSHTPFLRECHFLVEEYRLLSLSQHQFIALAEERADEH